MPSVAEMGDGVGTIQSTRRRHHPGAGPRPRPLYFRNDHHPDASVYLVNALVPDDRDIAVAAPGRAIRSSTRYAWITMTVDDGRAGDVAAGWRVRPVDVDRLAKEIWCIVQ